MAQNNLDAEKTQLEQAISHLEGQREALGDAVVDTALAPLREKLSQLDKQLLTGPSTSERRIVTILFCDVTGSTALAAELDPEEWTAIMQRIFPRLSEPVERYGGKVARLMGDGLLAFFGAPAAHEDDPERAVLAGLEILQGVAIFRRQLQEERDLTFNVRVGINTGLAVVGDVGSETAGEYTALGDAVNLAARMEQTAQPGTLQISQDTYKLIAPFFEVESLGAIPVKGLSEPVQTYRVQGRLLGAHQDHSRQAQGVAGIVPPITGREDELTTLRRLASQARQRRGQIVAIIGEAGLGKTRLIAELRNEWLAGPAVWQEMASTSYGGNRPYGTFQIQIQDAAGISPDDSAAAARDKLYEMLCKEPGHEKLLPLYEQLLGLEGAGNDQPQGEVFRRQLFDTTLASAQAEIGHNPTAFVYDDAQWTDAASLALEAHLLQMVRTLPVLMIFCFRPDRQSPIWTLREQLAAEYGAQYSEIRLQPLSASDAEGLVDHLFPADDLPREVRRIILDRSDGNPFFLEEIVRALVDQGLLLQQNGSLRWLSGARLADLDIPANVQTLLAARIDRLATDIRRTLQLAAVIGRSFHYRVLATISQSTADLEDHLGTLQEAELIREASRLPEWEFIFRHALTQEAAYRTLLRQERRVFHQRVGQALEALFPDRLDEFAPLLAVHFAEAGQAELAAHYYILAGDMAFRLYANVEATAHYSRALSFVDQLDAGGQTLIHLYDQRGRAMDLQSDHQGAIGNYEEMIAVARDRGDEALELAGLNGLATVLATVNPQFDHARALDLSQSALDLARRLGDRPAEAKAHWNLLLVHLYGMSDTAGAVLHGDSSLAIARQEKLTEQIAYTLSDLGLAYGGIGQWARGVAAFEEGREIWRELHNSPMLANNLSNSAIPYHITGDFEATIAVSAEAHEISRAIGNEWGQISSVLMVSYAYWELGQPEVVIARMARARADLATVPAMAQPLAFGGAIVAWIYAALGAPETGRVQFEVARDLVDTMPGVLRPWLLAMLTLREIETGALEAAAQFLAQCRQLINLEGAYTPAHIVAFLARGRLTLARGDYQEAISEFEKMLALFHDAGVRWLVADALYYRGRALLALGDWDEAIVSLLEARTVAAALTARRILWQINAALTEVEPDALQKKMYRDQAQRLVHYIADHTGSEALSAAFLALPAVQALFDPQED